MEIAWSGHSCFTLRGRETTLVLDPCPPEMGCATRFGSPQAIFLSHMHPGHSYTADFGASPRVFCGPGEYEVGGAFVTGFGTYHDAENGASRGKNTLYLIEMEGLRLCHAGDLGHQLNASTVRELGRVDILFLPVGNVSTLSIAEARALAKSLHPRYLLPMHFRTETARFDLEPLETFVSAMNLPLAEPRPRLSVSMTSLPPDMQLVTLSCDTRVG